MHIIQTEDRNELTKKLGYKEGTLPNAEYLSKRTIVIPIDPESTEEEKEYIVNFLNNLEI